MIYLTGQLLLFLLVSAFLGFLIGWLSRGALADATRIQRVSAPGIEWLHTTYSPPNDAAERGPDTDDTAWYLSSDARRP